MKVVAINGSPHKDGNTYVALKKMGDALELRGISTEILQVGDKEIRGCMGCGGCGEGDCVFSNDEFKAVTDKMYKADGLIIGTPVYYAGMAGTLKSFLDRAFFQSKGRMRNKVGAGVAIARRAGAMTAFEQINAYFLISEMTVAPSFYWNVGYGQKPGEFEKDLEGNSTFLQLAENMAWLLKMKEDTKVPPPVAVNRDWMNFIR